MNHISDGPIRWVGILLRGTKALLPISSRKGHTTKDYRTLPDHLGQLVKARKIS